MNETAGTRPAEKRSIAEAIVGAAAALGDAPRRPRCPPTLHPSPLCRTRGPLERGDRQYSRTASSKYQVRRISITS